VEHIPYPNTTLKALDNEIIQITLKTKKNKNNGKPLTNSVTRILFNKFISLDESSVTVGERILNQGKEVGTIKVVVGFRDLPKYAQMVGAVHHFSDGIIGGTVVKGAIEPIIEGKPFNEIKKFSKRTSSKKPKQRDTTSQVIEKHKSGPIFDIQPLPTGWERKINGAGRIFYVDHINKKTQWEHPLTKPTGIENSTNNNGTIKEEVNSETKLETKQKK